MTVQEERKAIMRRGMEEMDMDLIKKNIDQNYIFHSADGYQIQGRGHHCRWRYYRDSCELHGNQYRATAGDATDR